VTVEAPDEAAENACEIMNRFGARDLEQLLAKATVSRQEQESVPVVEEQVSIGKRKVLRGGVRVTSTVSERPVEETVRLRDETIAVEKHRTDRKLSPEEAEKAFQQQTVELTETDEEAVISKEARVVEEISLDKTVAEREETVQATARRTDVKIEKIGPDEQRKQ
jgi:stress response protein YsnF